MSFAISQFEPLATSSPFTCFVFTVAAPPDTVSFVWVACAATSVARLRAAAPTMSTRHVLEAARNIVSSP